ncbi:MAG: hypothetical protein F4137_04695 [Acidobacteria bacterium]|nr:hypothetical protein [Acidobacteriota bacterium]
MRSDANGRGPDRDARWLPWTLAALAVAYVAVLWTNPFGTDLYTPDSRGYIEFDPHRTAGYPLLLDSVTGLFGTLGAVPGVQLLLAAAGFAFLGWSIQHAFGAPRLALAVALSLFGNPEIAKFHGAIMTESVFVSLLCVMLGTMALLIATPGVRPAFLSALTCGVAVAVRPAGISLLPIWPLLLWFLWGPCAGRRVRLALAVAAPLLLCGAVEGIAWRAEHPDPTQRTSLANMHLFAKALMMEPVPVVAGDDLDRFLEVARENVAPARRFVAEAPDWQTALLTLTRYEAAGQRRWFQREAEALAERRDTSLNQLLGDVGWRAVSAAPVAWAHNGLVHYVGLWGLYELLTPSASQVYAAYMQPSERVPFGESARIRTRRPPHAMAWPGRVVMAAGFLATVVAVGIAVVRRLRSGAAELDRRLLLAAVCGLLVHGHYVFVALFGIALARYSLAVWPLLALCGFLLVHYASSRWSLRSLA